MLLHEPLFCNLYERSNWMLFAFLKHGAYGDLMRNYSRLIFDMDYNERNLADVDPDFRTGFNVGPVQWEANVYHPDTERAREALLVAQYAMDAVISDHEEYAGHVHTVAYDGPTMLGFLVMSQEYSPRQMSDLQRHLAGRVNDRLGKVRAPFWLPWSNRNPGTLSLSSFDD